MAEKLIDKIPSGLQAIVQQIIAGLVLIVIGWLVANGLIKPSQLELEKQTQLLKQQSVNMTATMKTLGIPQPALIEKAE
jgi:hypothetical protein